MSQLLQPELISALTAAFGRGFFSGVRKGLAAPEGGPPTRAPQQAVRRAPARRAAPPPPPPAAPAPKQPPSKRAGFERVHYRQGRGTFEARILRFESKTRMVELERLVDGKRLWRPVSKVYGRPR